jgi:hypothetical protein
MKQGRPKCLRDRSTDFEDWTELEAGNWKNWKLETGSWKLKAES